MDFRQDICLGTQRRFWPPLMNGGGCCKTIEEVVKLAQAPGGAIILGSITQEPRDGNPGNVFWVGKDYALNALGMPNRGAPYLRSHLRDMVNVAHDAGKALVVNVAGFNRIEYSFLTQLALEHNADAVEINLGCPNVIGDRGSREPITAFDLEAIEEITWTVTQVVGKDAPIWMKVSPYTDPGFLRKAANVLMRYQVVKAVTATNTFPNGYILGDDGKSVLDVGYGGVSGAALKSFGPGQIMQWKAALEKSTIVLIAAGGIASGWDIHEYSKAGAVAFQMTTELLQSGELNPQPLESALIQYSDLQM